MKRAVSWLLILCLVLSLVPGIPMTASADTLSDPNYIRWVSIRWGENGEYEWNAIYNHETQQEETSPMEELPAGVTYESGSITLENAELYSINMDSWGTIPVHVTVLGENTITCAGENNSALSFLYCHDVTIDGGGSLTLRAEFVTLRSGGGVAGTWTEEGGEETYEDSRFVIRDVTIDTENTSSGAGLEQEDGWMQAALSLYSNVLLENAELDIRGHGGLEVNGDLTIRNCTIDATGLAYSCRHTIAEDGDDTDAIPSEGLITDSVLNITTNDFNASWMPHTMVIHPAATLTIGDGAEVNLDHTDKERDMQALDISGDYLGCGLDGSLRVEGGRLNIRADDPNCNAIVVSGDWVQTGGEVIVEADDCAIVVNGNWVQTGGEIVVETEVMDSNCVWISNDATWLQTGGSISLNSGGPDIDVEDEHKGAAMDIGAGGKVNMLGGTLSISGGYVQGINVSGDLILGGTELNLETWDTGLTFFSQANVVMMGGSLSFTCQDPEHGFGIWNSAGAGFTMTGGTMDLHVIGGLVSWGGLYRFLGGELRMESELAINGQRDRFTFGEGIHLAYDDGTEPEWYIDAYVFSYWEPVTIKSQTVSAKSCYLLPAMFYPNAVVAGTPAAAELIVSLTSPQGTVAVDLPEGAELDESGVFVNGDAADYRLTDTGFELDCANGSYVTFQLLHDNGGVKTLTARAEGLEFPVTYSCSDYTFTVPPATHTAAITADGRAMAGGSLEIYATGLGKLGTATVNQLGTWRTTLELPEEGTYYLYGILYDPEGNYVTTAATRTVVYETNATVLESLTVGNWIHGATELSPNEYVEVTFDYINHTASSNYYTYWPELPEFDFTARFQGDSGTPEQIRNVRVLAMDEQDNTVTVPLSYDAETGNWTGQGIFCDGAGIIPNRFQVRWENADGSSGSTGEEETDPRVAVDEDYTTGAVLLLTEDEAGEYRLPLTDDATVESIIDGLGEETPWTMEDADCLFTVVPGEMYIVTLSEGGFEAWPEKQELTIIVEGGGDREVIEYQPGVKRVSGDGFTDWTDTTFESTARYSVGDVLLIDEAEAVTVTGVEGTTYTYRVSGMDEIYADLDVSGFGNASEVIVTFGETEEELAQRFRESSVFAAYEEAIQQTIIDIKDSKEFKGEIDGTTFKAKIDYHVTEERILLKPEITITTTMTTKRPNKEPEETTVEAKITFEIREDLSYRIRSRDDDRDVQSYMLISDETITSKLEITASIGEEDGSSSKSFDGYFADEVRKNFLEKLKKEPGDSVELLKDARISVPVYAGITIYARPSLEVEWNYFGELTMSGEIVEKSRKGISMIHLGDSFLGTWDDWNIAKYDDPNAQDRSFTASTGLHLSAYLYPALRMGVGVSVLKTLDLEVWAKAGPKVSFDGHGEITFASKKPVDVEAELLVDLTLESEAGVGGFINIGKTRKELEKTQFQLWKKSLPIRQFGFGVMPTQFEVVEEDVVYVSSQCNLGSLIDLRLDCQNFKAVNGITEEAKVLDRERYTFELRSGAGKVTLSSDGELKVLDTKNEFEFEVKVTYTGFGTGYRLWKIVPMKYTPGNITITKRTPAGPAGCTCLVVDITNSPVTSQEVGVYDTTVIPAINGHTYVITEIRPPDKHTLDPSRYEIQIGDPDTPDAYPEGKASFFNTPIEEPEPPDPVPIDPIGDPSGFVFEGIESNRLSGVTTTLYQADDETGANARLWDAGAYDQQNPLTTDAEGKYMWMVPNGWWQVRYELDGYDSAESEWMIVPPIRTEVNQNLVTDQPAAMTLSFNELEQIPVLSFSRPVQVSTVTDMTVLVGGEEVGFHPDPVNAQWSVTADPMDSVVCAVDFRLHMGDDLDLEEKTVTVTLRNAATYYGTVMEELSAELTVPAPERHSVTVIGGSGSGTYEAGEEVLISAQPGDCAYFEYWESGNTRLYNRWEADTAFRMPDRDVTVTAVYRMEHSYESTVTDPTCTEEGFTTHTCAVCGDSYTDSPTPVTDHTYGDWTLVIAPTVLETGMETRSCTHCGHSENRLVDPLGNPFNDVPEGSFYYDSVLWAVEEGVTNGTTPITFGPGEQCMRAQVVTFLWRAAGSPEPASDANPFVDVKPGDFYYKAVLWAVETGVTSGMDATHFGPTAYCNRAQVVTFLHRSLGSPAPENTDNPFTDVPDGQWYTAPVLWAVEKGVTNGLSATAFGPTAICNRAQIVTFLYRAFAK